MLARRVSAFAACLLLVYGVNVPEHPSNTLVVNVGWLTILTLCTTILLLVTGPVHEMVFFYNCLRIDSFSLFLQVIILLSVISVILLSLDYLVREGIHSFEYMVLILLSSCSMLLMVSSYDLIGIYLTIESPLGTISIFSTIFMNYHYNIFIISL